MVERGYRDEAHCYRWSYFGIWEKLERENRGSCDDRGSNATGFTS